MLARSVRFLPRVAEASKVSARAFSASAPRMNDDEENEFFQLNFSSPYGAIYTDKQVAAVYLPGEEGDVGVCPGHVPIMVQLRPGVVRVAFDEAEDAPTEDWFVTGGWATVMPDTSVQVAGAEVYSLDDFDTALIESSLNDANQDVEKAEEDSREQMEAQLRVDTFSALAAYFNIAGEGDD